MKERSLVAFTLLTQTAVGAFVTLEALYFGLAFLAGTAYDDMPGNKVLLAIGLLVGLGLLASFFHLGTLANAWRALSNISSSWLSREIFFMLLFVFLGALYAGLQWLKIAPVGVRNVLAGLAVLSGLSLVFSISRVYSLRTIPVWNTLATPVSFFTTAFLLGALLVRLMMALAWPALPKDGSLGIGDVFPLAFWILEWIGLVCIALIGVELLIILLGRAKPGGRSGQPFQVVRNPVRPTESLFWLRLVLLVAGAGILLFQSLPGAGGGGPKGPLAGLAFILVLASEIIARFLFYEAGINQGL